ncbi:T9SS type A sorting domain-containing protein [uncultured Pontibacter sp.]|uniref:T9SS type A sorting domain-containing protein n=1 Tax=uncultured Pontibacter sp. TaxID=453356 RepID=UPI00260CC4FE|nr:T9SS type A sorting domain-containing protein [uncultured Pontibacter sp.]
MKTPIRLCIALLLALMAQSYSFAQTPTVSTTLNTITNVRSGITEEFTVTTQGGSGQMVVGRFDFDPYQQDDIVLQYKGPGQEEYTTLAMSTEGVAIFGPEQGFAYAAAATTHNFRILFARGITYNYTLSLVTVGATPETVATASGTVAVTTPTQFPTIDGTLDNVSQQKGIVVSQAEEWQIFVTTNQFAGVMGNIQIVLGTPAQRNNITLQYNANRAATTAEEVDFQPLAFNEQGIATIGPATGERLTEEGIEQLMRVTFAQPGDYTYTLRFLRTDGNTLATVTETVTATGVAGIGDMIGNTRISVYPTLANGAVRVDLGEVRNASIAVTDMLGRVVMQLEKASGSVNLNTSGMAKGTYFVKVIKGKEVAGSRFIVR